MQRSDIKIMIVEDDHILRRTIVELVANLGEAYPDLQARICDADGNVRRFINLYKNDEDIRALDGADTTITDGDVIAIVPAIAGG